MRPAVQQTLKELERFQCSSGGFAYWPGACSSTSPYLTAYLLHVFRNAADLKYTVDAGMRSRAYAYLEKELAQKPPVNEGWWPSYTAWQAFAVKVLVEGGRHQDSNLTRLYGYRERMPVFALAYLHDALVARGTTRAETPARLVELRRRMANAVLPEAASAARRGARRSLSALVLELERPIDGHRARHAGARGRGPERRSARSSAG